MEALLCQYIAKNYSRTLFWVNILNILKNLF